MLSIEFADKTSRQAPNTQQELREATMLMLKPLNQIGHANHSENYGQSVFQPHPKPLNLNTFSDFLEALI